MNLGTITASLRLSMGNFQSALKQVHNGMKTVFGPQTQTSISRTGQSITKVVNNLKDVERIVSGILISQAFYNMTNDIQRASAALGQFMGNMEKAQIAMEYFLGNTKDARTFILDMKEFAAQTSFNTEQALTLSRKLMAAQFRPEYIRDVMEVLNDAAAASGGTAEQIDRIVLALTQMRTNGKITGQEMRQLAEAGIPIYQILHEELGLLKSDIMQIGDLKIDGDLGVTAILTGLEKRYKGAARRIAGTVPGLWETIKDDTLIIFEAMFQQPYAAFRKQLTKIRDSFEMAREEIFQHGFGGLFEKMFAPATQSVLRTIIGSVRSLANSFALLASALKPSVQLFAAQFATALAIAVSNIALVARWVAVAAFAITEAIPQVKYLVATLFTLMIANGVAKGLMLLWRVTALGFICSKVAQAVEVLAGAIMLLSRVMWRNPILMVIGGLATGLGWLAVKSGVAGKALDGLGKAYEKLGGIKTSDIFKPKKNDAADTSIFDGKITNDNLADVGKNLQDVKDKAKKAGKAMKDSFTAGFDEVFQVPEKLGDAGDELDKLGKLSDDMGAMDVPMPTLDSGAVGGNFGMPKIDTSGFVDKMKGISAKVKEFFTTDLPFWTSIFFTETLPMWTQKGFNAATEWLRANGPGIVKAVVDSFNAVGDWFMQFEAVQYSLGLVKKFIETWGPEVSMLFSGIWEGIKVVWEVVWTALSSFVMELFELLKQFWETWGGEITGFFQSAFELVVSLVTGIWEACIITIKLIFDGLKLFWQKWGDDVLGVISGFFKLIASVVYIILNGLMFTIKGILELIKGLWKLWGDNIMAIIKVAWEAIVAIIKGALTIITTTVGTAFAILNSVFKGCVKLLEGDWKGAWDAIKGVPKLAFDWIVKVIETVGPVIRKVLKAISTIFEEVFKGIGEFILEAIIKAIELIIFAFTGMRVDLKKVFADLWEDFKDFINQMIDGINGFIQAVTKVKIKIPEIKVPGTDVKIGGGGEIGWDFGIGKIPKLETGGIVNKHTLIEAGEKNHREAVVPLQNATYMKPFSDAVAAGIIEVLGGGGMSKTNNVTNINLGTLIGDERSLRELERKLHVVRQNEQTRRL